MQYIIREIGIKGKALIYRKNGELICYKSGKLEIYDLNNKKYKEIKLPLKLWKKILCRFRLLERLLHIDARWGIEVDDSNIFVQFDKNILSINISNGSISKEDTSVKGKPLSIMRVENISGFDNMYVVGDYTRNEHRNPVALYGKKDTESWKKIWEFPGGGCKTYSWLLCR